MRGIIRGAAAAIAVSFTFAAGAQAQTEVPNVLSQTFHTAISCSLAYDVTDFAFDECSGAWNGNNSGAGHANPLSNPSPGATITETYIQSVWGISSTGTDFGGGSVYGPFVLAVKGATSFSLFYFASGATDLDPNLGMYGVSYNSSSVVQGLSHATVYGGRVVVPEPGTLLLIATGLLGMALIRRREEFV